MKIPVVAAAFIAEEYAVEQVVIWTLDASGEQQVVTFGNTADAKVLAARAGNRVKRAAGWPRELCEAKPDAVAVARAFLNEGAGTGEAVEKLARLLENYAARST